MLIARGKNLAAIDYIVIAGAPGEGFDLGRLGACVRFSHAEGLQPQLARGDARQIAPLLFFVAGPEQQGHRVHLSMAGSGVASGMIYLLENNRTVERREPRPAVFLREERGKPSRIA